MIGYYGASSFAVERSALPRNLFRLCGFGVIAEKSYPAALGCYSPVVSRISKRVISFIYDRTAFSSIQSTQATCFVPPKNRERCNRAKRMVSLIQSSWAIAGRVSRRMLERYSRSHGSKTQGLQALSGKAGDRGLCHKRCHKPSFG